MKEKMEKSLLSLALYYAHVSFLAVTVCAAKNKVQNRAISVAIRTKIWQL